MKAITICQPWASLIVLGIKTVENRSWPTNYRGPLAIHAGKGRQWMHACEPLKVNKTGLVFGSVIGVVEMVDCVKVEEYQARRKRAGLEPDPFATGPWCHVYAGARAIEPVSCNGSLSFWQFDERSIVA